MGVRVTLTTLAVAAAAVVGAPTSGGAPQRLSTTAFTGTYAVSPLPGTTAALPWTNGGTLTIQSSSRAEVERLGFRSTSSEQSCFARELYPDDPDPAVSAWYVATWSWKGGGTVGGCVSRNTRGTFVGASGKIVFQFGRTTGGGFAGCWGDDSRGCLGFAAQRGAGSAPPAGGTPKAGRTRTIATPAPGGTVEVTSPQDLPACPEGFRVPSSARATCNTVDVSVTAAPSDLKKTTLVGEGGIYGDPKKVGEAVAACWLIGPDALTITPPDILEQMKQPKFKAQFDNFTAQEQFDMCLFIVDAYAQKAARETSSVGGASARCRAQRIGIAVRVSGKTLRSVGPAKGAFGGSARYACTAGAAGLKVKVTARAKGGLRTALGKKLDLGVVRTPRAPKATGKLAFKFAW